MIRFSPVLGSLFLIYCLSLANGWSQPKWKDSTSSKTTILKGWPSAKWNKFGSDRCRVDNDPTGTSNKVFKVTFKEGTYSINHGCSFVTHPIPNKETLTLEYKVYFDRNFQWGKGGKLPGLYGSASRSMSGFSHCTGGEKPDDKDCFSTRYMWRGEDSYTIGQGEVYVYVPKSQSSDFQKEIKKSYQKKESYDKGVSLGSTDDDFRFKTGTWQTLKQRVTLNTPGKKKDCIKVWLDSKEVYSICNVNFRNDGNVHIQGIKFSAFLGGGNDDWDSPETQSVYFKDFKMW